MAGDLNVGFVGSVIYTLSIWRLNDVYIRAAAGEYAAMAFLPLIVLGFFQLFSDEEEKRKRRTFIYLVLGYFGVIQTHMLTSITVTVFLAVVGSWILIDFDSFWTFFHHIFFAGNDLWLLDLRKDVLIMIVPPDFFNHLVITIVITFIILLVIAYIILSYLSRKGEER